MGQIERTPALAAEFEGILHDGHHAEPKQVDFDDAQVFAVILIPLRHHAPRHGSVLQRDKGAEGVLANDHPAGVLAEVTRQPVNRLIQLHKCAHARMFPGQTGLLDLRLQIERVRKIPMSEQMGKSIQDTR